MTEIVIFSKPGCHLCDQAKAVLEEVRRQVPFLLREVDIERDETLLQQYQYDIPVIFVNGRKAFKHRLTAQALQQRLAREPR